ncbi:MAG: exodeoxyribonuclease III [Myxococcaceae bacterium]
MKIYSWNVNGIRAATNKGFENWLQQSNGDIIGLQEVRAFPDQIAPEVREPQGYFSHFSPAKRPGYSGVGLYSKQEPDEIETSLGVTAYDEEGRVQIARFGKLYIANIYFPNGQGKDNDNSRIPFKLAFYKKLFDKLGRLNKAGEQVLVMGDFNTAHQEIDIARPKENAATSGFTPQERKEFDRVLAEGWTDTFRQFEKGSGFYSWWSKRGGARSRNVGWRIDYVLASKAVLPRIKNASIEMATLGSDHCPVSVELD